VYVCVCVWVYNIRVHNTRSVGGPRYVLNYYLIKPLSLRGSYGGRTRRYSLGSRVGNGRIDLSLEGLARPLPAAHRYKIRVPATPFRTDDDDDDDSGGGGGATRVQRATRFIVF